MGSDRIAAARRARVTGRVQGVFFRASTAERARALALRGHARNLPDGSVDVLAGGSEEALAELLRWLQHGPPMARVDRVDVEVLDPAQLALPEGFETR